MDIFRRNGFDFVDRQPQQQQQQGQHSHHTQQPQQQQQRLWSKPPRSKAAAAAAAAATAAQAGSGPTQAPATGAGAAAGDDVGTHIQDPAGGGADCGHEQGLPAQPAAAAPDLEAGCGQQEEPGQDGCEGVVEGPAPELLLSAVPVLKGGASGGS
jgi:hypothetical protein